MAQSTVISFPASEGLESFVPSYRPIRPAGVTKTARELTSLPASSCRQNAKGRLEIPTTIVVRKVTAMSSLKELDLLGFKIYRNDASIDDQSARHIPSGPEYKQPCVALQVVGHCTTQKLSSVARIVAGLQAV